MVPPLPDAGAYWVYSTNDKPWTDMGTLPITASGGGASNTIVVDQTTMYQQIDGWGGAFNEKAWDAITSLSQADQNTVMESLFAPSGCNFNLGRIPIGASDYADEEYSDDDVPAGMTDYSMADFNITEDLKKLIPYIKAAMVYSPNLMVWGSPWSPPAWMKNNDNPAGGSVNMDSQTLTALATYFTDVVQAYQKQGIKYYAVFMQNEPDNTGGNPTCGWNGTQEEDFIKTYMGPAFQAMNQTLTLKAQIWLGTLRSGCGGCDSYTSYTTPVLGDSTAAAFITGVGGQYWQDSDIATFHSTYPNFKLMMTETEVQGADQNDWNFASSENFELMQKWMAGWANAYMQWNTVLDQTGDQGIGGGNQNSMITIDTNAKTITYNPQYYSVKHYTTYVYPGAHRIKTSGTYTGATTGFLDTNGMIVVVTENPGSSDAAATIQVGNQQITAMLPAQSFNTFRIVLMN